MQLIHLRAVINILAMLIGVIAVALVFFFPDYSVLIFSMEVLILPTIYIVGNAYIEEKIKEEYNQIISSINSDNESVERNYHGVVLLNRDLMNKNRELKAKLNQRRKNDK